MICTPNGTALLEGLNRSMRPVLRYPIVLPEQCVFLSSTCSSTLLCCRSSTFSWAARAPVPYCAAGAVRFLGQHALQHPIVLPEQCVFLGSTCSSILLCCRSSAFSWAARAPVPYCAAGAVRFLGQHAIQYPIVLEKQCVFLGSTCSSTLLYCRSSTFSWATL